MIDFQTLYDALASRDMQAWAHDLPAQVEPLWNERLHGDLPRWQQALARMPEITPSSVDFNAARVRIGQAGDTDEQTRRYLEEQLRILHPWRKGPYELFGIHIDTEWRSDWKWARLGGHIQSLQGRAVLDVGCGSGYHCWRMHGAGADLVLGIDPSLLFLMQFQAIRKYTGDAAVHLLPLGIDAVPRMLERFDTVFSMGVLYHRRSPLDHILHLKECLRPGGELVLETLVVDGDDNTVLMPEQRYGKMANVWFIPSVSLLEKWLRRTGMQDIRVVDVSATGTGEQRSTSWMTFQSLADFLDPKDSSRTVEGYPAPVRAVVLANKPA